MGGPWCHRDGCGAYPLSKLTFPCVALACIALLAGCAGGSPAPVKDHSQGVTQPTHRTVRTGDTLYSIAWDVGLDFKTLARWNQIESPYVIRPGQRLRTTPPDPANPKAATRRYRPPPSPTPKPPIAAAPSRKPTPARALPRKTRGWVWPTNGRVIAGFSPRAGRKGIDISGKYGQAIRSAAAGRVVYAGTGLRGYGQLIIVKHDETFLSAYAHNRKLLVKEGNEVIRGEQIAEMGRSGSNRVKLHFQIRRRGTPVDPKRYLPRR